MTLLNYSVSELSLGGNGTTLQDSNQSFNISLKAINGVIDLSVYSGICPYCNSQAVIVNVTGSISMSNNSGSSNCPPQSICNVAAIRKMNGSVAVQVSTGSNILLNATFQETILNGTNNTQTIILGSNTNLTLTLQDANGIIKVHVDNDTCSFCNSETAIVNEPATIPPCVCTILQKCYGECEAIAANDIIANTVVVEFNAAISQVRC